VILQDQPLLQLMDAWICELQEQDFVESLPLLRRSLSGFDSVSRRRLLKKIKQARRIESPQEAVPGRAQAECDQCNRCSWPSPMTAIPAITQIMRSRSLPWTAPCLPVLQISFQS
jgi:hypothetical protein